MAKTAECATHGDELVWEPGGYDMPTTRGRHYCPTCQDALMNAADYREEWKP